jgi:hypothetical protein
VTRVKGGWLEHEIRSLPQVLACSITKDDVVVLVQPSADPVTVERAVEDLLRRSGVDRPVRVFGGARPVFVEPVRVRNGRSALVGTIGGAAILAAGVWLAGATTGLRGGTKTRATVAALAPQVARELVDLPVIGGDGPSVPDPRQPLPPLLRPASSPIFGDGTGGRPDVSKPRAPSPPRPRQPRPHAPAATECKAPHAGVPVREKVGGGNGPPSWSHSIFVPAHCTTGRPR